MKKLKSLKSIIFIALFIILFAGLTNNAQAWPRFGVFISTAPVEVISTRLGPDFVWIRGHYRAGYWGNLVWVPGHWKRV